MVVIRAIEYVDPSGSIVKSGQSLAEVIVTHIEQDQEVMVGFETMKGLPSSYFNAILHVVKDRLGLAMVGTRLSFRFDSSIQESVFNRSLRAAQAEMVHLP